MYMYMSLYLAIHVQQKAGGFGQGGEKTKDNTALVLSAINVNVNAKSISLNWLSSMSIFPS